MSQDNDYRTPREQDIIEKSLLGSSYSFGDEPIAAGTMTAKELAETEDD